MQSLDIFRNNYKKALFVGGVITLMTYITPVRERLMERWNNKNKKDNFLDIIQALMEGGDRRDSYATIRLSREDVFSIQIRKETYEHLNSTTLLDFEPKGIDNATMIEADVLARNLIHITQDAAAPTLGSESDPPTPLEVFGIQLSSLRRRKEVSLEDLASWTGISRTDLLKIEVGLASLDQIEESLPILAKALDVSERHLSRILAMAILEGLEEETKE